MYHEVPYALSVFVDKFEEKLKLLRIEATLNVERGSQKKILIGHKGEMLKKIGTEARKELEELFGMKVYLQTFVKVVPDWRESPQKVRELDWHFQLEGLSHGQWDGADPAAATEFPIDNEATADSESAPEVDGEFRLPPEEPKK
jgi:GTP-binding protein Era